MKSGIQVFHHQIAVSTSDSDVFGNFAGVVLQGGPVCLLLVIPPRKDSSLVSRHTWGLKNWTVITSNYLVLFLLLAFLQNVLFSEGKVRGGSEMPLYGVEYRTIEG